MEKSGYFGSREASEQWKMSQAKISKLCREGKIPGAEQDKIGSPWRIPREAKPPV